MRVIQKFALPLTAVLIAVFAWGLSQSAQQRLPQAAAETASPWDSLTAAEYETAAAAVTRAADGNVLFVRISLKQPDKQTALAWQPGTKAVRHVRSRLSAERPLVSGRC